MQLRALIINKMYYEWSIQRICIANTNRFPYSYIHGLEIFFHAEILTNKWKISIDPKSNIIDPLGQEIDYCHNPIYWTH